MITAILLVEELTLLVIPLGVTAMATRLKPIGNIALFEAREYRYYFIFNITLEGIPVEYFGPHLPYGAFYIYPRISLDALFSVSG